MDEEGNFIMMRKFNQDFSKESYINDFVDFKSSEIKIIKKEFIDEVDKNEFQQKNEPNP